MTKPKYDIGEIVTITPGKMASNRKPVKAEILARWMDSDGVYIYAIETCKTGLRGNFDELHIKGK